MEFKVDTSITRTNKFINFLSNKGKIVGHCCCRNLITKSIFGVGALNRPQTLASVSVKSSIFIRILVKLDDPDPVEAQVTAITDKFRKAIIHRIDQFTQEYKVSGKY